MGWLTSGDPRRAIPTPAERVKLAPLSLERLKGLELGEQFGENLGERPDVVIMAVETDVQSWPGGGILERAGVGLLLVQGVDVAVRWMFGSAADPWCWPFQVTIG